MWIRDKNCNLVKLNRKDYPSDKLFYIQLMKILNNKTFNDTGCVADDLRDLIYNVNRTVDKHKR
jgi:hypothetical protein